MNHMGWLGIAFLWLGAQVAYGLDISEPLATPQQEELYERLTEEVG